MDEKVVKVGKKKWRIEDLFVLKGNIESLFSVVKCEVTGTCTVRYKYVRDGSFRTVGKSELDYPVGALHYRS